MRAALLFLLFWCSSVTALVRTESLPQWKKILGDEPVQRWSPTGTNTHEMIVLQRALPYSLFFVVEEFQEILR